MKGDTLVIKKAFADPVAFDFIDFTTSKNLRIDEAFNVDAFPEILFLTKYIGDYNISKYGDKLVLKNGFVLVVKRIQIWLKNILNLISTDGQELVP